MQGAGKNKDEPFIPFDILEGSLFAILIDSRKFTGYLRTDFWPSLYSVPGHGIDRPRQGQKRHAEKHQNQLKIHFSKIGQQKPPSPLVTRDLSDRPDVT